MIEPLPIGEIHLWGMRFATASEPDWRVLSDEERARAARLRSTEERLRFGRARGLLRFVLAGYLGLDAAAIRFDAGPHGKPRLAPDHGSPLTFNLAHCRSAALLAVAAGREIGVDVEDRDPIDDLPGLVAATFPPSDAAAILAMDGPGQLAAFLRGWTRKEAVLKALGIGFSAGPELVSVPLEPGGPWRVRAPGHDGTLGLADISRDGLTAALAGAMPLPPLCWRTFEP